ncbi:MAG TPA: hypothetical protein VFR66_15770 [Burkholderiales bacterium]|nr:hypothetical protein [Burkholderiales bacterium]
MRNSVVGTVRGTGEEFDAVGAAAFGAVKGAERAGTDVRSTGSGVEPRALSQ